MGDSILNNSGNLTNALKGLVTGNGGRGFQPNADRFTMIVDSGTSGHLVAKNKCMLRSSNNTPEEATVSETKRQRALIQGSTPEKDTVAEVERQREHILDSESLLLDEAKSSTTTAGALSTGAGVSSPRAGAPSPRAEDSPSGTGTPSSGVITSISPGDAPVASPGVASSIRIWDYCSNIIRDHRSTNVWVHWITNTWDIWDHRIISLIIIIWNHRSIS